MALTDTHVRNAKPRGQTYKLSDGGGMYLLVRPDGARYWRLDYRFVGKRRTLALGVYPTTTLAVARARREDARALLAQCTDPNEAKKAKRRATLHTSETTFEVIAREWLHNQRKRLAPRYCTQVLARLQRDVFPEIGSRPIAEINAPSC
jgi:Arm DNA-binding domain/Phage integrase central domain